MEHNYTTPQRALRSTAAPTPDQPGVLREGNEASSPAPRFPTASPPSAAQRSGNASRATPSYSQLGNVQQQQQRGSYRHRGWRSNHEGSELLHARDSSHVRGTTGQDSSEPSRRQHSASARQANRPRKPSPSGNSPDEDRRRCQRDKQIHFGYATDGYVNMERLIRHDPLLKGGGLLPLSPPTVVKGSKRIWDIQLRKWRRALHMFDYVFIDGEDDPETRATVLEEQRRQWVSEAFQEAPRELRKRIPLDALRRVQHAAAVPTTIPVEDDLRCILRSEDCYESVRSVVPQSASSLTKGTDISPLEAGIKIHIAPSSAVLQRQQVQQELQQRLTALQQQQLLPSPSPPQAKLSVDVALSRTPLRRASPPPTAAAAPQQTQPSQPRPLEAPSPSPRRPPLPSPVESHPVRAATTGKQQRQQQQQQRPSASYRPSESPSPVVVRPTAAVATAGAVVAPMRGPCSAGFLSAPSSVSATMAMTMTDSAGASASQPAPFSLNPYHRGRLSGEASVSSFGGLMRGQSPPTASAVLAPSPFPGMMPPPGTIVSSPTGIVGLSAPGYFAGPAGYANVYSSMLWGEASTVTPAEPVSGVVYGVSHAAPVGAPWVVVQPPPHLFADPSAVHLSAPVTTRTTGMPPNAARVPAATAIENFDSSLSGRLSGSLMSPSAHPLQSTNRFLPYGVYPSSLERITEAQTPPSALLREGGRRGGGGGGHNTGVVTPQTIPRFVARLSTSPSEQRLGRHQQQHHEHRYGDAGTGATRTRRPESSPFPSQRVAQDMADRSSMQSPSEAIEGPEKSPSFADLTPERALFGAAAATAEAHTEARPVPLRGDSVAEGDDGETAGKERMEGDGAEGIAAAPLNFHTEAA
ncbi:hypothetical protein ABB37_05351 [Leptomonas pyrrhocoris]|uniref:Histone RNA hairpin-binding protein RNA-binding domain-containing protein n=1 Tax=Leptomonas pyrrhocoris TaxID=157538 RepID=A0A0N0DV48_LEPPY|nr:hypothetical protein ABB37_05351 [Leptomonas pyrrhocoris]KPA79531.1 hypothetical protein ABB37_05351 [Leptomonas pyrrhocoris]|eukprot:XP_015657970.1 hypothetical protein ABB37_05351 [Leptomonas pyrrhocoris]